MKKLLALPIAVVLGASGCSQIAQLQPVAGGQVTAVRTATNDVLVDKKVDIGVAPVCALDGSTYVCNGTTADGKKIRSEAVVLEEWGATKTEYGAYTPADVSLKVTVGRDEIFNGKVENVLESNAQEAK